MTLCDLSEESSKRKIDNNMKRKKRNTIEFIDTEEKLKIERIQQIMNQEAELACMKRTHEEKICKMKEEYLREMNCMQLQHLKEIQTIEIQTSKAKLRIIQCSSKDKENIDPYNII